MFVFWVKELYFLYLPDFFFCVRVCYLLYFPKFKLKEEICENTFWIKGELFFFLRGPYIYEFWTQIVTWMYYLLSYTLWKPRTIQVSWLWNHITHANSILKINELYISYFCSKVWLSGAEYAVLGEIPVC